MTRRLPLGQLIQPMLEISISNGLGGAAFGETGMRDDTYSGNPLGPEGRQPLCLASAEWRLAFFK